jgi:mRNA-degrading endonuclease RelE of RelBE toxin-antitoxin system
MAQTGAALVCLRLWHAPRPFPLLYFDNYTLLAYSIICVPRAYRRPNGIHRSSGFHPDVSEYMADDEYREFQDRLARNPELGDLMPGTGGFRKLRWADARRGKGRRGGMRIIYYYFSTDQQIWLMTIYGKDEASDLTPNERKALKNAIESELHSRQGAPLRSAKKLRRK